MASSQCCPLAWHRMLTIPQSKEATVSHISPHHGVIVGVDTHKDEHVAVGINQIGARLGEFHLTTTTQGYVALERWATRMGEVLAFGVEGTGSYGAGLARYLIGQGHTVIEVNRPDRSTRRRQGKSDPIDAEMAARAVLSGVARETSPSLVMIRSRCSECSRPQRTPRLKPVHRPLTR